MLPSFLSPDRPTVNVPAPLGFRPVVGTPRRGQMLDGSGIKAEGNTAARAGGLRYERTVSEYIQTILLTNRLFIQPILQFCDATGPRRCIPDLVILTPRHAIVAEVKIQHMPEAWWQLRRLYQPVVASYFNLPTFCLEIVKSFDAAMPFPEQIKMVEDLLSYLAEPFPEFAVYIWRT